MKRRNLLLRVRLENNVRTVRIDLTKAGEKLVDRLMPIAAQFEQVGTRTFSDKEVTWLKKALKQIHANLQELDAPKA